MKPKPSFWIWWCLTFGMLLLVVGIRQPVDEPAESAAGLIAAALGSHVLGLGCWLALAYLKGSDKP